MQTADPRMVGLLLGLSPALISLQARARTVPAYAARGSSLSTGLVHRLCKAMLTTASGAVAQILVLETLTDRPSAAQAHSKGWSPSALWSKAPTPSPVATSTPAAAAEAVSSKQRHTEARNSRLTGAAVGTIPDLSRREAGVATDASSNGQAQETRNVTGSTTTEAQQTGLRGNHANSPQATGSTPRAPQAGTQPGVCLSQAVLDQVAASFSGQHSSPLPVTQASCTCCVCTPGSRPKAA